jgi:DNA-binding transcriptional LysR family regulator
VNDTPPALMSDHLIRHLTLRQLQIYEASVRYGSLTRAAEALFLTQPTVSMQIKKLTDTMGLPLFEQVGRALRPTEAGTELYKYCRQVFATLSDLEVKMADLKGIKTGRLTLGVITAAKCLAPEVLGEFCQLYPGIEVALNVCNRDQIIDRIKNNEDDLFIMGQAPVEQIDDIEAFPFAPNPLVVMAPRHHPLVGQTNIPLARIAEDPVILREPGSGVRNAMLSLFAQQDLNLKVRMELGSNEAIKHAIVASLGLSVLSLHALALEGPDGPVALLDVEGFPIMRKWYIVHRKGKQLSLIAQAFLEFVRGIEPQIREQLQQQWPDMKEILEQQAVIYSGIQSH